MNIVSEKSLSNLQVLKDNNKKQQNRLNEFTLEVSEIYQRLLAKKGVVLGSTNKYWIKLNKNILFIITSFLSVKDTVKLRLINTFFRQSIELVYPLYLKKYQAKAQELEQEISQKIEITQESAVPLQQAQQALQTLTKAALVECKSLGNPPQPIYEVFSVLQIVLQGKQKTEPTWKSIQLMLANTNQFLNLVLQLDIQHIEQNQIHYINELCQKYGPDQIASYSFAASQIFRYLLGIHQYLQVPAIQQQLQQQKAKQKLKVIQKQINFLMKYQE